MSEAGKGRIGSSFDEEGIHEEVEAQPLREVLAWQIEQEMKAAGLTKNAMARRMSTSRTQVHRLLDPANTSVTPHTLQGRHGRRAPPEARASLTGSGAANRIL